MRFVLLAALALGAAVFSGCPKPVPPVVGPTDASDAAAPAPTCEAACAHLVSVPCAVRRSVCRDLCQRVEDRAPGYAACLNAATTCSGADACDPGR